MRNINLWAKITKKKEDKNYIALSIGLGMYFCVSTGMFFDNLAIGIGLGMSIGAIVGALLKKVNDKK